MSEALLKYAEEPGAKHLPKRVTLFPSHPDSLTFYCFIWALVNLALFLFPAATTSAAWSTFWTLLLFFVDSGNSLIYTGLCATSYVFPAQLLQLNRFSSVVVTIGLRRASLTAETIETLMFVKARLTLTQKAIIDLVREDDDDSN
ncbi:hypothetical protein B0H19DRAFT_1383883 [Mycena capillaripes]|nr:hypothetical protein B0H19DRAFT_1383883 [Mycena capillaripes]